MTKSVGCIFTIVDSSLVIVEVSPTYCPWRSSQKVELKFGRICSIIHYVVDVSIFLYEEVRVRNRVFLRAIDSLVREKVAVGEPEVTINCMLRSYVINADLR